MRFPAAFVCGRFSMRRIASERRSPECATDGAPERPPRSERETAPARAARAARFQVRQGGVPAAAAQATTPAATATAAAATTAEAAAATTGLLRLRLVHRERTAVELAAAELVDRGLALGLRRHLDEPEAARAARVTVGDDAAAVDRAGLREELAQIVLGRLERKVTNVQFHVSQILKKMGIGRLRG